MAKVQTAFRIDEDVKNGLPDIAKKYDRSQNWIVNYALGRFIEHEKKNSSTKKMITKRN